MAQSSAPSVIRGATVTTEDGGRLNAFASEPRMEVVEAEQGWGFHERAEKLNGRVAMLGFITLLATEIALGGEAFHPWTSGLGLIPRSRFEVRQNHLNGLSCPSIQITRSRSHRVLAALALADRGNTVVLTDPQSTVCVAKPKPGLCDHTLQSSSLAVVSVYGGLCVHLLLLIAWPCAIRPPDSVLSFGSMILIVPPAHEAIGWILDHRPLMAVLLERFNQHPRVSLYLGGSQSNVDPMLPLLQVAADGPRSSTRRLLGDRDLGLSLSPGMLTAKVVLRGVRAGTAYEVFRPEGPMAVLPPEARLPGGLECAAAGALHRSLLFPLLCFWINWPRFSLTAFNRICCWINPQPFRRNGCWPTGLNRRSVGVLIGRQHTAATRWWARSQPLLA